MELVTIEGVPLAKTGTYQASTGEVTFTAEDFAAAVAALNDPAVHPPRVRIAALEALLPELDPDPMIGHGGVPAFGRVENLRTEDLGETLVGDLVVPRWLADTMEWAWPARSIEAAFGVSTATGGSHEMVCTALALLGVELPAVTTLEDLPELFAAMGPTPTIAPEPVAEPRQLVAATTERQSAPRRVAAGLDQDLVRRRWYDALDAAELTLPEDTGSPWAWWIRSLRFDDDGTPFLVVTDDESGRLYRVDFTVSGNDVTFTDPTEVVEQYVAATAAHPRPPIAAWGTRAESRPNPDPPTEEATVDPQTIAAIRESAGLTSEQLPDDATEEQVREALAAAPEPEGDPAPTGDPEPEGEPTEQQPVAASQLPEGVVAIDADELARLRQGAETAQTLATTAAEQDRDRVIAAAIEEGRFAPARRDHYVRAWASDPEGTRTLLTAAESEGGLAPNTIPVAARGEAPQDDGAGGAGDEYPEGYLSPVERARVAAARSGTLAVLPGGTPIIHTEA